MYNIWLNAWEMFSIYSLPILKQTNKQIIIPTYSLVQTYITSILDTFCLAPLCVSVSSNSSLLSLPCPPCSIVTISTVTTSIVTISNYFWLQSWSLVPGCISSVGSAPVWNHDWLCLYGPLMLSSKSYRKKWSALPTLIHIGVCITDSVYNTVLPLSQIPCSACQKSSSFILLSLQRGMQRKGLQFYFKID